MFRPPRKRIAGGYFAVFEAKHLTGVAAVNKDPKAYIEQNR